MYHKSVDFYRRSSERNEKPYLFLLRNRREVEGVGSYLSSEKTLRGMVKFVTNTYWICVKNRHVNRQCSPTKLNFSRQSC